jgi:chromosome segregation ATPase
MSAFSEQIENLTAVSASMGHRIRDDVERIANNLGDRFVDAETFGALRAEVDLFREATSTSLQASIEEREATRDQISDFSRILQELKAQIAGESAPEVIGSRVEQKSSADDVRKLEQKIQGIDSKVQRDFRKLKSRLRELERTLEEIGEKARQEEVMAIKHVSAPALPDQQELVSHVEPVSQDPKITESVLRITGQVRLLHGDFQLFFLVMFALCLYFVVADLSAP